MQFYRKSVCFLYRKYRKSVCVSNGDSEKVTERLSRGQLDSNFYILYPRAGEVIETAGQLGTCPQKILASDASFYVPNGYRPFAEGALEYEQEELRDKNFLYVLQKMSDT